MDQTKPTTKRTSEREFKLQVVHHLQSGEKQIAQICREHSLCQTVVRQWREQYEQKGENAWLEQTMSSHVAPEDKARIADLHHTN